MNEVIWQGMVDNNKFKCCVTRLTGRTGQLTVIVVETGKIVLDTEVQLSYNAMFGPDVDDVRLWQDMSIDAIDASGV